MVTLFHVHHAEDELWYVIDGQLSVHVGGETYTVEAGDIAFGPRGVPHAFRADEDASRYLVMRNAGGESFFEAVGSTGELSSGTSSRSAMPIHVRSCYRPGRDKSRYAHRVRVRHTHAS